MSEDDLPNIFELAQDACPWNHSEAGLVFTIIGWKPCQTCIPIRRVLLKERLRYVKLLEENVELCEQVSGALDAAERWKAAANRWRDKVLMLLPAAGHG